MLEEYEALQKNNKISDLFNNISNLALSYDVFILDVWGVIHNGTHLYPGVLNAIDELLSRDKKICFLSNMPRPSEILEHKLIELGIDTSKTMLLTSGDLVRTQLKTFNDSVFKTLGKRCYHLGAERNHDILSGIEIETVNDLENADFVLLSLYHDPGEDQSRSDFLLKKSVSLNLPAICANPDTIVINQNNIRYCAGVFAKRYENLGGKVYYYGKPYVNAYNTIFEKLNIDSLNKNKILMIGDTVETDIKGARDAGIHSALTLTGNTSIYFSDHINDELSEECLLQKLFEDKGLAPNWIIDSLKW